jgi:hypothetical protein
MKTNKTVAKNKDSKKAAKKELQQNLSDKFFEAVKSLGHDAEKIGEDLMLVSKFVAKKLSRKVTAGKKAAIKKVAEVLPDKSVVNKKEADVKMVAVKGVKKAQKVVKKATASVKPVVNSVKVTAVASEEKLIQAIAKPTAAGSTKATKATKTATLNSSASKSSTKKAKSADEK